MYDARLLTFWLILIIMIEAHFDRTLKIKLLQVSYFTGLHTSIEEMVLRQRPCWTLQTPIH